MHEDKKQAKVLIPGEDADGRGPEDKQAKPVIEGRDTVKEKDGSDTKQAKAKLPED